MTTNVSGKNIWRSIPSLRIVIGLIIGILFEYYYSIPLKLVYIITALVILMLFFLLSTSLKFRFNTEWISGLSLSIICIGVGCFIAYNYNVMNQPSWIDNNYKDNQKILLTLQEPLTEKDHFYKAVASVELIQNNNQRLKTSGNVLVYIRKDSTPSYMGYGSQIVTNATLTPITNAGNPGGFDYARYCLFQGITHQVFINADQYVFISNTIPSHIYFYLFKLRDNVLGSLKMFLPHQRAYGVAEALLIGYRNDLDREIVQAYSNTGVVHIIAISGLHLGMLYGSMVLFFNLFKRKRWTKFVKPIVILIVIWGFALIAGGVPSIMRSAFMFSFILISEIINKKTKIYNTLSLSALCMILTNPFCIWDVGFQLSYAAVLSIIMYSGKIKEWFYLKNKVLQYLWQLNAVTISAQIWTFPLIIYYFHQFPRLVFISNMIVVPLSCIILYAELFLLIIATISSTIAVFAGKAVQISIEGMNWFIYRMSSMKFGIWEGLKVNPLQTILLFFLIYYIVMWLQDKSRTKLMMALAIGNMVLLIRCYDYISINRNQQKIMVYNIPKYSVIELMNGSSTISYTDTGIINGDFTNNFHLKPAHIQNRAKIMIQPAIPNLILVNNKRIVVMNKPFLQKHIGKPIPIDVLIISHNPHTSLSQLMKVFDCKQIVIDGSNNMWKTEQMIKENKTLLLPLITTQDKGAYIRSL